MGRDHLAAMARIAAQHDGIVSVGQAEAAGVSRRALQRAQHGGLIVSMHTGIYRFTATPTSSDREIRAAVLAAGDGARASHESSLHLHGLTNIPLGETVVSVPPRQRADHPGIRVHRLVDQHPEHLTVLDGIATTTLARAVVDVSSVFSRRRMEWLLDEVTITRRSATIGAIARVYRQVNHRGRRRIAVLGELLDEQSAMGPTPRSTLERKMDELLLATMLPTPAREYPIPSVAPGAGFADRAWEDALLILEIDGRTYHERRQDMRKDRARDRTAARMGWQTMRVLDAEVTDEPDLVVDDVVATYHRRLAQLHGHADPPPNL